MVSGSGFHLVTSLSSLALNFPSVRSWGGGQLGPEASVLDLLPAPSVPRLILGMMVTTSFLSMWLSNTASTAMMLPIANAILKSLFGQKEARKDLSWDSEENAGEAVEGVQKQLCKVAGWGRGCPKDAGEGKKRH